MKENKLIESFFDQSISLNEAGLVYTIYALKLKFQSSTATCNIMCNFKGGGGQNSKQNTESENLIRVFAKLVAINYAIFNLNLPRIIVVIFWPTKACSCCTSFPLHSLELYPPLHVPSISTKCPVFAGLLFSPHPITIRWAPNVTWWLGG